MNYYNEIKEKLIKSEIYDKSKEYSKDRHKVGVYFEIVIVLLAVALVSVWLPSPCTYGWTYNVPTFVKLGTVVVQLPHVELSVLVL